ncbi:XrtN system VIT domain-containing protein [Carboxylicivirga caseinilyticus]|uniref:XrtN system VIT domain-containing protein n=1 Tax=Carboxylicivirga caseinilyticus TaxID=3417572 RepID=UPI003D32DC5D|nr:XrtN system VIT domain-containing protein [Marinilabiliaceae bacterium A049]
MKIKLTNIQAIGIFLFIASIFIYYLTSLVSNNDAPVFFINYILASFYFLLSFGDLKKGSKVYKMKIPRLNWHILLSILAVSCFTLNKTIEIFTSIPTWLEILLFIGLCSYMIIGSQIEMPKFASYTFSFFSGISITIFLYYSIILIPFAPFAIIGLFLLGLSIHLLIPYFLLATTIVTLYRKFINAHIKSALFGVLFALLFTITYVSIYSYHQKKIESSIINIVLEEKEDLPDWISYAQNCHSEYWTKRIIGHELLYDVIKNSWWSMGFNTGSFSELKVHDPLVSISAAFNKTISLSRKERIKIINSITDSRHYSYEKLWSGKDLNQSNKLTDIRIYPEYRIAYAELNIWTTNNNKWENNRQEALYTFQLPEGAVATSLSLWINGKEEKSRLTTRKKAANAYKTVVGVELRDPVVLHWQEGNRLTATIFPCTPKEARRLKIGFTIPLKKIDNKLFFDNIRLQGPDSKFMSETIHLKIVGESNNLELPSFFKQENNNQYIFNGSKRNDWKLSMSAPVLSDNSFSFNKKSFKMVPLQYQSSLKPQSIYLDINKSWNKSIIRTIINKANNIPVFVYDNEMLQLTNENKDHIIDRLLKNSFSIFPVHKVTHSNALLITEGNILSPVPSELKGSSFYKVLTNYIGQTESELKTIVIDGKKSAYISTLEQYKALDCQNISEKTIKEHSIDKWFKEYNIEDKAVTLSMSEVQIVPVDQSEEDITKKEAPSHLMRLYNYHSILQQAGHLFLQDEIEIPEKIYDLCQEAYIVSPISSLIVLETIEDYKRFNIEKNKNSLQNATLKDSGAVPEPEEWALILTLVIIITISYLKFRK